MSLNLNLPENSLLSSYNYKEILTLLLNIIRFSITENFKIPSFAESSEDLVNFNNEEILSRINNTVLGESLLKNLPNILKNFDFSEKELNIDNLNETTFGIKTRNLGYKR